MLMAKRREDSWVSTFDSDLNRWVSFEEMNQYWYRTHQARRLHPQLNHPMFWVMQSNALHRSALCVWNESVANPNELMVSQDHKKVALMLGGMSIECAIKARWITKYPFPLNLDQQKKVFSGAHDLVALARSSGVRTNSVDRKVLAHLSAHVRWLGRYPTPKATDEFVTYMLDRKGAPDSQWAAYLSFRDKLGNSISGAIRRWRP